LRRVVAPIVALDWQVVVNNGVEIPGTTPENEGCMFNSYNPPSVTTGGLVILRARSRGQPSVPGGNIGGPVSGIYHRHMHAVTRPITKVADCDTYVPYPNNLGSAYNEFPSIPRCATSANNIVTRGMHSPTEEYVIGNDPTITTRAGTTGLYLERDLAPLLTGASNLGAVPDFCLLFQVPGVRVKFVVFPGAPAVTDSGVIVFVRQLRG
jgi:hypothetical protein